MTDISATIKYKARAKSELGPLKLNPLQMYKNR